jgi:N-acetylmuramoyl-L-alanine amidase
MPKPAVAERPSPNFGERRGGLRPSLIVIHYTAMPSAEAALERLSDSGAEVSAHYLISNRGEVTRLVDEEHRAWHAGAGSWAGEGDVNSRSIGIELDNLGTHPFSEPQMRALEDLLRGIMDRWGIAPEGVIGHSDLAPDRKGDPGPRFDWARLARQGLAGHRTGPDAPQHADWDSFHDRARQLGYSADVPRETLLAATRLRFAPWREGPLLPADLALHHGLDT